eukprot:scaffold189674_cov37-Tisochrysis_lutea.AAC.3
MILWPPTFADGIFCITASCGILAGVCPTQCVGKYVFESLRPFKLTTCLLGCAFRVPGHEQQTTSALLAAPATFSEPNDLTIGPWSSINLETNPTIPELQPVSDSYEIPPYTEEPSDGSNWIPPCGAFDFTLGNNMRAIMATSELEAVGWPSTNSRWCAVIVRPLLQRLPRALPKPDLRPSPCPSASPDPAQVRGCNARLHGDRPMGQPMGVPQLRCGLRKRSQLCLPLLM